jgi:hypothetical protein
VTETYHGVPIPEWIWRDWMTPFEESALASRIGVRTALKIDPESETDSAEVVRLRNLAEARDAAEQAAFEETNKDQPWMQRRMAFRKSMKERKSD